MKQMLGIWCWRYIPDFTLPTASDLIHGITEIIFENTFKMNVTGLSKLNESIHVHQDCDADRTREYLGYWPVRVDDTFQIWPTLFSSASKLIARRRRD